MADRSFNDLNRASRARIERLLARLEVADYALEVEGGWTVGALLAHVAFWDRMVEGRWQLARARGGAMPHDLGDAVADLVNDASLAAWRALEPEVVARLVTTSASAVDAALAALPDGSIEAVTGAGRPRLVDRSRHRAEHLDMIEATLAGEEGARS